MRLALLVLTIFAAIAFAEVNVRVEDQVENVSTGYCGWCALETMGRQAGYKSLRGLVRRKLETAGDYVWDGRYWLFFKSGATRQSDLRRELKRLNIPHRHSSNFDRKMLREACEKGCGAVVGLKPRTGGRVGHAVLVVGYEKDRVAMIDSNHVGRTRYMSRKTFDRRWRGTVLMILPKG